MKKNIIIILCVNFILTACSIANHSSEDSNWPDSTNTGLINPDILTACSGYTVYTNGTVIENLEINGRLTINAGNVTVINCRIWGGDYYGIKIESGTNILIRDCEIGKTEASRIKGIYSTASGDSNIEFTVKRCYIHHVEDGIFISGSDPVAECKCLIEDCYMTGLIEKDDSHNDGIEVLNQAFNIF